MDIYIWIIVSFCNSQDHQAIVIYGMYQKLTLIKIGGSTKSGLFLLLSENGNNFGESDILFYLCVNVKSFDLIPLRDLK